MPNVPTRIELKAHRRIVIVDNAKCAFQNQGEPLRFLVFGFLDQSEAWNLSSRPIGSPHFDFSWLCAHWEVRKSAHLALSPMPNMPTRIELRAHRKNWHCLQCQMCQHA